VRAWLAVLVALQAWAPDAVAARRRFAWVWDTDTLPQRTVELEWWVSELTGYAQPRADLAVHGVVGLTDTLELALPLELRWRPELGTDFYAYGLDLRWRLASPDLQEVGPVIPMVRAGVRRLIQTDEAEFEGHVIVSIDAGRAVRAVLDTGATVRTGSGAAVLTFGAGVSYALGEDLHLGIESYGEKSLHDADDDFWITAGPNLSFTHGRFWITAALPIGLHRDAPDFLPRIVWAAAL
jgi:hypothetical protein